ncbi:hypothetical protein HNQ91_005463 [Filimonas zeae]|uniref:Uncharacterized protein n=1 Tax=Filimonas zeae TaxID=1737353 RepID=A0A917J6F7_9BACT|nr:hypothetical protein [Filimonas zeae]MDR6342379.1 hypothetical protein [Filimonas zeae]GGH81093.1 hypothetical protein GCM10011379_52950 [Filimonas zeae]
MSKFWKVALLVCLGNFLMLGLAFTSEAFMAIGVMLLIGEFFGGLILCFMQEYRTMGAGMLAGFGMFVLIGFSACTLMLSGLGNMH